MHVRLLARAALLHKRHDDVAQGGQRQIDATGLLQPLTTGRRLLLSL